MRTRFFIGLALSLCLFSLTAQAAWPFGFANCTVGLDAVRPTAGTPRAIAGTEFGILDLAEVPAAEKKRVRTEIIALAQKIYDDGKAKGTDTLFPIDPRLYDGIEDVDRMSRFSQVVVDKKGTVVAFVLAYYNPESQTLHLEKIGVDAAARKLGLMSQMLNVSATQARKFNIQVCDLLVVKKNTEAQAAYEKLGFTNDTPAALRNHPDPRYNAYGFSIPVETLVRNTTRP